MGLSQGGDHSEYAEATDRQNKKRRLTEDCEQS